MAQHLHSRRASGRDGAGACWGSCRGNVRSEGAPVRRCRPGSRRYSAWELGAWGDRGRRGAVLGARGLRGCWGGSAAFHPRGTAGGNRGACAAGHVRRARVQRSGGRDGGDDVRHVWRPIPAALDLAEHRHACPGGGRYRAHTHGAIFVVVSPFSGLLAEKLGVRLMISGGVATVGSGLLVLAATAELTSVGGAEAGLALTGVGMGLATGPLFGVAAGSVSAARSSTAGALINVARMAGATIGVAVLGAAFAVAHGGAAGLRVAMLFGGLVQLICAGMAWRAV